MVLNWANSIFEICKNYEKGRTYTVYLLLAFSRFTCCTCSRDIICALRLLVLSVCR